MVASWNKGAEHIKGYTAKEIIGKSMNVFYTPKEIANNEPVNNLATALKYGHYETKGWRVKKDGSQFYANIVFTALYDDDGNLYGYAKVTKDITEETKAEEQIHFLATIANNIQDTVISIDSNFCITTWSNAAIKLFGFTKEEVTGKSIFNILNGIHNINNRDQIIEALKTKSYWRGESVYHSKTGFPIIALSTISPLKNTAGDVIGNLLLIRDISEQKEAEVALNHLNIELENRIEIRTKEVYKNEKKYRALAENNYDIILLLDNLYRILYCSPSTYRISGFTTGEMQERDFLKFIHSDDLKEINNKMDEVAANPKKNVSIVFRHRQKKGNYIWIEGTFTNLLMDENVQAIILNAHDVTERVNGVQNLIGSEKLYRNLFENILHGFAYCKVIYENGSMVDFTYAAVNSRFESLMKVKNITGKKASVVMPGLLLSDPQYVALLNRITFTGTPEKMEVYLEPLKKWISISIYSPDKDSFVGLVDNITERKEAEQKIKQLNVELEKKVTIRTSELKEINNELEAFSYTISHDLRAPLRNIIGFASILEEEYIAAMDDEARRLIGIIKNNTTKMGKLIDDLLGFSKLSRKQIGKTDISMNEMVKDSIASAVNENNGNIHWLVATFPVVTGDANTIRQVWLNLISNAIKYSSKNSHPVIEIGWQETTKENIFFVKDNGVGFDIKYKDKLFKVFQRLHTDTEFEGTGVGLAIVEKIISKHGGNVWAEATEESGACFYFSLPK